MVRFARCANSSFSPSTLLLTLVKLFRPGRVRAVAAESLLVKPPLLISNRSRHRAPNLTTLDRVALGLTYPFHDRTITVTHCGRVCFGRRKINLSTVFAGQNVGVKEVSDKIWLVTFMHYDLGFFDHETGRLENIDNPFAVKVLPMCPEWTIARADSSMRSSCQSRWQGSDIEVAAARIIADHTMPGSPTPPATHYL